MREEQSQNLDYLFDDGGHSVEVEYVSWQPGESLEIIQPKKKVLTKGYSFIRHNDRLTLFMRGTLYALSEVDSGEDGYQFYTKKIFVTSEDEHSEAIVRYDMGVAAALEIAQLEFYEVEDFLTGLKEVSVAGISLDPDELIDCYVPEDPVQTFRNILEEHPQVLDDYSYNESTGNLYKSVSVFRLDSDDFVLNETKMVSVQTIVNDDWDKLDAVAFYLCRSAGIAIDGDEDQPSGYLVPKSFLQAWDEDDT